MRILFDQGTPVPLRHFFGSHTVSTSNDMGWSLLTNGKLLDAAEPSFGVLITTDKKLRYQQNLTGRNLAILVLPFTSWPKLKGHVERIVSAAEGLSAGEYLELVPP